MAGIAGVVSYSHIVALGLRTHQGPADSHLLPIPIDGLIVAGSVILAAGSPLGWLGVALGVGGTLFANLQFGIAYGALPAAVSTWPAVAFTVATFMLERWLKSQRGRGGQGGETGTDVPISEVVALDTYVDPLRIGLMGVRTALYRYFNAAREVIYIGITYDFDTRHAAHLREDPWAAEIASYAVEWFDDRLDAAKAEVAAVLAEKPKHNKATWLMEPLSLGELFASHNGQCRHATAMTVAEAVVNAYLHGRDCIGVPLSQRKLSEAFGVHRTKVAELVGSLNGTHSPEADTEASDITP